MNIINDIINFYSNNKDFIDYNKLITLLLSIGIKGLVKRDNWKSYFGEKFNII